MVTTHHHGHDVGERLYLHGHSLIHRLPAQVKVVAMITFIFTVIATPNEQFWAFGVFALFIAIIAMIAKMPPLVILPRMMVEVPFALFAVLMPFFGPEPNLDFLGLSLSQAGLLAGWGILIKGTLGVISSIILAGTTPARDLLLGLERLHVPPLIVQIASFMLRYVHVVADEMNRMKLARESRGFDAKGIKSWPIIAHSAGSLFIRSYERGERVHLAMLSRGYTGRLPEIDVNTTTKKDWLIGMLLPLAGLVVYLTAWSIQQ